MAKGDSMVQQVMADITGGLGRMFAALGGSVGFKSATVTEEGTHVARTPLGAQFTTSYSTNIRIEADPATIAVIENAKAELEKARELARLEVERARIAARQADVPARTGPP